MFLMNSVMAVAGFTVAGDLSVSSYSTKKCEIQSSSAW
jgi:hypothetical protein